jgi:hypothetical protein
MERAEEEEDDSGNAPFFKNWAGLHLGFDFSIVSGDNICSADGYADNFRCYTPNDEMILTNRYAVPPVYSTSIDSELIYTSTRILASYERVLAPQFTVGGRLGFAFGGGPVGFLPLHLEATGAYWIRPINASGFRPYVSLGGGVAQADAYVEVTNQEDLLPPPGLEETKYDAYKHMGLFFIKLGAGLVYPVSPTIGLQLNLNGMYMFPSSGIVIQPSLGGVYGFDI